MTVGRPFQDSGPLRLRITPNPDKILKALGNLEKNLDIQQAIATAEIAIEMRDRIKERIRKNRRTSGQFMPGLAESTKKRRPLRGRPVLIDDGDMIKGIRARRATRLAKGRTEARVIVDRSQRAKVAALSNLTNRPSGRHHKTTQQNREFFGYSKRDVKWAEQHFFMKMGVGVQRSFFNVKLIS